MIRSMMRDGTVGALVAASCAFGCLGTPASVRDTGSDERRASGDGGTSGVADGVVTDLGERGGPPDDGPASQRDAGVAHVPAPDASDVDTGLVPPTDFLRRCAAPGVVRCVGFDAPADIAGRYGDNHGTLAGATAPALDTAVRASGSGSLRFTLPARAGSDTSGAYFTNFSDDLAVQFDGGEEFYVQWRQRFSSELVATRFAGGGGWKQLIVTTGDRVGCNSLMTAGGQCASSCTAIGVVTQSYYHSGFPILYNSCTGSTSHGPYEGLYERFGDDFKLQNARPSPYCLYTQGNTTPTSYFPPTGNCFGYVANEWMTFQIGIRLGPRTGDEFVRSQVFLWGAREGRPSEPLLNWGSFNLTAGPPGERQRFGKVWLLPYNTGRDASVTNPVAYTWYDELIVSRTRVADPS